MKNLTSKNGTSDEVDEAAASKSPFLKSRQQLNDLLDKHDGLNLAVAALIEGLKAEKTFWSKVQNDWINEPDYPTRVRAAELVLAYREGRPIERKEIVTLQIDNLDDITQRMRGSPELMKQLKGIIDVKGEAVPA